MNEYMKSRMANIQAGRPLKEKKKYVLNKVSPKRAAKIAEQKAIREETGNTETELQQWYAEIMAKETPRCWETNEWIDVKDTKGWHGSIAHILDKKNYPSVKTHPLNYMILKMWGGTHGQFDSSWENASKMKIWPHAVKIINLLYPLLKKEEKARIHTNEVIMQELKPELYNS